MRMQEIDFYHFEENNVWVTEIIKVSLKTFAPLTYKSQGDHYF